MCGKDFSATTPEESKGLDLFYYCLFIACSSLFSLRQSLLGSHQGPTVLEDFREAVDFLPVTLASQTASSGSSSRPPCASPECPSLSGAPTHLTSQITLVSKLLGRHWPHNLEGNRDHHRIIFLSQGGGIPANTLKWSVAAWSRLVLGEHHTSQGATKVPAGAPMLQEPQEMLVFILFQRGQELTLFL